MDAEHAEALADIEILEAENAWLRERLTSTQRCGADTKGPHVIIAIDYSRDVFEPAIIQRPSGVVVEVRDYTPDMVWDRHNMDGVPINWDEDDDPYLVYTFGHAYPVNLGARLRDTLTRGLTAISKLCYSLARRQRSAAD